ncbi:cell division protein ZapA [Hutsoniella sourekii]
MSQKQRIKARINDKDYTIVGSKSQEHMNTVADIVNRQLDQLAQLDPSLSIVDRSILMAINAVSDQIDKEREIQALTQELDQLKARDLSESKLNHSDQPESKHTSRSSTGTAFAQVGQQSANQLDLMDNFNKHQATNQGRVPFSRSDQSREGGQ